jgi:hypothetical protein
MDELTRLVSERTGIPADKAGVAIATVVGYLKDKLPAPVATQLDAIMSGEGPDVSALPGEASSFARGIEGMFDKRA